MFGKLPFPGPDMDRQILEDEIDFPEEIPVSDYLKECIEACLQKDPE